MMRKNDPINIPNYEKLGCYNIGPGPLPKYRAGRVPTTAGKFEGGLLVQAILTKAVFACEKPWDDAVLGPMMTSTWPSSWSWSHCTNMATFA